MNSDIVCKCSNMTVKDIKEFFILYPNMPIQEVRIALKIGIGCKCCLRKDCPVICSFFEDVIKNLKNSSVL